MENFDLIQKAFKKLKSNIYYDKTNLPLRDKIVSFECNYGDGLDKYLEEIYDALRKGGEKWAELVESILSSIRCIVLPKTLKNNDQCAAIITNFSSTDTIEVDKYQTFIDMNVEGHIMGMLWLFQIGWKLDKELPCCYGNRIRSKLRNEFSKQITFSPYLFEPYFDKYESWRDTALQLAETHLSKNEDVLILTLDFERFYYSVDITESFMKSILRKVCTGTDFYEDIIISRINILVHKIITQYSEKYYELFPDEEEKNILPIGFLPSNVIANWCLKPFDDALTNGWNPLYYGRYVDDILIVEKVEKNSSLYLKASENQITVDDILSYYLVRESRWKGFEAPTKGRALFKKRIIPKRSASSSGKSIEYSVLSDITYPLGEKTNIKVQDSKAKIFYFKGGQSDALISCFRENINKNKSEFRRMPEDDAVFLNDDYSEIYELEQKGINKFREVSGISLDKYGLSKYLGKYQRVSGLVNDKRESKFIKDIEKIFNSRTIIENYTLWEKVLTILFVNDYSMAFTTFINSVAQAIESLKEENSYRLDVLKESLTSFLVSSIYRVYSLNSGREMSDAFESLSKNKTIQQYCMTKNIVNFEKKCRMFAEKYFITRMTDKSMCILWPDVIIFACQQKENRQLKRLNVNCYSFSDVVELLADSRIVDSNHFLPDIDYKYYPYLITMYDLSITYQYFCMIDGSFAYDEDFVINMLNKVYIKKNYQYSGNEKNDLPIKAHSFENSDHLIIKVGSTKSDKIRVAVSSIKMDELNFENIIKGKPNRKYKRYQQISCLVNTAIQQRANLLVMPEACVPIEWLSTLARTCAKNNMAVITGVEHVVVGNKVYNLTAIILPFEDDGYRCAHIAFHSKNHFAPDEVRQIQGYRLKTMDAEGLKRKSHYELYNWNNFWFSVYCCYELASIVDRSLFQSYVDAIVAVEWNHDVNYYSNILESLSRDLHCYCIQVNSCDYGDSRVTKPSKTESKDILRTKGGEEASVLVGTIDIAALRDFQIKEYELQRDDHRFKPTPPQFNKEIALRKILGDLYEKTLNVRKIL